MATGLVDGAGRPIVRDSKYPRLGRWWAGGKRWTLWLIGSVAAVGGIVTWMGGPQGIVTTASSVYHWAWPAQEPSAIASEMTDEEVSAVLSVHGEPDKSDGAASAPSVTIQKLPEPGTAASVPPPAIVPAKGPVKSTPSPVAKPPLAATVPKKEPAVPPASDDPIEVTSITFHDKDRLLDVMVRNKTDRIVVISQIILSLRFVHYTSKIDVSGTHDLGPLERAVKRARDRREPFGFSKGINVAYQVPANGVDRYQFRLNFSPADLYIPKGGGRYFFQIVAKTNRNRMVRDSQEVHVSGGKMYFGSQK